MRRIAISFLVLLAALCAVAAQTPPPRPERRVALIVGNGAYPGGALANPVNDARAMAEALRRAGFEVDVALDASYLQMGRAVRRFADRIEGADVALFYFAGHGVQIGGSNYLLPVDAQLVSERDAQSETMALSAVIDAMRTNTPRVNLIILDACRDNPLLASLRRDGAPATSGFGLAPVAAARMLIAFSTEPGAVSVDGSEANSPFTAALVREMAEPGVEIRQLFTRVRTAVRQATQGRQVPWDQSSLESEFYFSGGPERAVTTSQAELVFWQSIMLSGTPGELELFLRQFPDGRFAELARARLEALRAPSAAASGLATTRSTRARDPGPIALGPRPAASALPPEPQAFAAASVPFVAAEARAGLVAYERHAASRVLALAGNGAFAWRANVRDDAEVSDLQRQALESCEYVARSACVIYAVGDRVQSARAPISLEAGLRIEPGRFDFRFIPFLSGVERDRVREAFGEQEDRRALAISPSGAWGAAYGLANERQARAEALRRCEEFDGRRGLCLIYAVGERVVANWP
jgi:hypothetical protein